MDLARPEWLWCFAALPLLAVREARGRARRAHDWVALGQGGRPPAPGAILWISAAAALSLALAQPRWGQSLPNPLPPGHDVVLALDVSRSMAAADAVPDRLGVALESAESLIAALGGDGGDRVAVVAFAGRGVLRCPLTGNLGAAAEILRALRPGCVRPGGTDLGAGLDASLDAFDDRDRDRPGARTVVVFSDGEDLSRQWRPAAERLRARGVVVHTVAVGDREVGHPIPAEPGKPSEPIRYHGSVVLSRRSDEALAAISRETGGAFLPLGLATVDLGQLYRTRIEPAARASRTQAPAPATAERFPLFLLAALTLILAANGTGRLARSLRPGGAVMLAAALAGAVPAGGPAVAVARGRTAYAAGRYDDALLEFRQALRLAPGHPTVTYDLAATLYQLGQYEEARNFYLVARPRAGSALRVKIEYALGNTALAVNDLTAATRHYDACIGSKGGGGELDRVRRDASDNRRFVEEQMRSARTPAGPDRPEQRSGRPKRQEGSEPAPKPGSSAAPDGGPQNAGGTRGDPPPAGARGAGAVGGPVRLAPRAGSPREQLARALDDVREARRRRIGDVDAAGERGDRQDW